MYRYCEGSAEALSLIFHSLPMLAHKLGCNAVGGYVPTLPWLIEILDASPVYTRMTATEQVGGSCHRDAALTAFGPCLNMLRTHMCCSCAYCTFLVVQAEFHWASVDYAGHDLRLA